MYKYRIYILLDLEWYPKTYFLEDRDIQGNVKFSNLWKLLPYSDYTEQPNLKLDFILGMIL